MVEPELHEIVGASFRLPVWLRRDGENQWAKDCVRISLPKMPWLKAQKKMAEAVLNSHCARRDGDSGWILEATTASALLHKSKFADPQDVVVWNFSDATKLTDSSFITAYCNHRDALITDHGQASLLWMSMCKFAFFWAVEKRRPVHCGYWVIDAMPFRQNWLSILVSRLQRASRAKDFDFAKFFYKHRDFVTAFNEHFNVIRWSIVATPTEKFHAATQLHETTVKRMNPRGYVTRVRDLIAASRNRIHEIITTHLAETDYKIVRVSRRKRGSFKRDHDRSIKEITPADLEPAPNGVDYYARGGRVLEAGQSKVVAGEDARVSALPAIQSPETHVRNGGGNVDQHEDGAAGAAGLLVLDAAQSVGAHELLGVRRAGGDDAGDALAAPTEQLSNQKS